jgi:hypothetical protein
MTFYAQAAQALVNKKRNDRSELLQALISAGCFGYSFADFRTVCQRVAGQTGVGMTEVCSGVNGPHSLCELKRLGWLVHDDLICSAHSLLKHAQGGPYHFVQFSSNEAHLAVLITTVVQKLRPRTDMQTLRACFDAVIGYDRVTTSRTPAQEPPLELQCSWAAATTSKC